MILMIDFRPKIGSIIAQKPFLALNLGPKLAL